MRLCTARLGLLWSCSGHSLTYTGVILVLVAFVFKGTTMKKKTPNYIRAKLLHNWPPPGQAPQPTSPSRCPQASDDAPVGCLSWLKKNRVRLHMAALESFARLRAARVGYSVRLCTAGGHAYVQLHPQVLSGDRHCQDWGCVRFLSGGVGARVPFEGGGGGVQGGRGGVDLPPPPLGMPRF